MKEGSFCPGSQNYQCRYIDYLYTKCGMLVVSQSVVPPTFNCVSIWAKEIICSFRLCTTEPVKGTYNWLNVYRPNVFRPSDNNIVTTCSYFRCNHNLQHYSSNIANLLILCYKFDTFHTIRIFVQ